MTNNDIPILWSFRRCPYAMRARLAIKASGVKVRLREILLRDKPEPFLSASAKGTVPVLELPDGQVIDESLDVMFWALEAGDPQDWLAVQRRDQDHVSAHLMRLDTEFKHHLDRYKYATRYDDVDESVHRAKGAVFLAQWNEVLAYQNALSGTKLGLLDYASLPFVRQFRIADRDWFDAQSWPYLHRWLQDFLASDDFAAVMHKYKPWKETGEEIDF